MPNINIDGKDYDTNMMSSEAKAQLASLQFVEKELQRLNAQIAVHNTARAAYFNALKAALTTGMDLGSDTIKLS